METNQINILPLTMLRDLEQVDETQETRFPRQLRSDVWKADRLDGIHFDLAFLHAVPGSHFHVRANPDSDAAGDFTATNSPAKTFGEHHGESLHRRQEWHFDWRNALKITTTVENAQDRYGIRRDLERNHRTPFEARNPQDRRRSSCLF